MPVGIALIPCDSVYADPSSGKQALIGMFNLITARAFPVIHPRMCIFASLTDVHQNTRCKVDIVNGETDAVVFSAEGPMAAANPTVICDMIFQLNNLTFQEPGTYFIRLIGNGQILLQRPFNVVLQPPQPRSQSPQ